MVSRFSHVWLFATPWTVAHQAPLSMGILLARILEWGAMPSSRGYSEPRDQTWVSFTARGFFTVWTTGEALSTHFSQLVSSVAQSCLTLCDPMDCSSPGFPVHHQLSEFTQTHVNQVGDDIQPSPSLSSLSPPVFNLSQHFPQILSFEDT